eukprot:CAMPEP_0117665140 /NCGR_PEP_ID=MMETSP0804-20121206/9640_1 /TAXON_ID=1074897 /ORGANISM="Tetraselmis astigmatica, Strain CCMP880" /LENGTH=54 /DNA_ID=CAMNT_0005472511 /DNA_START=1152 /DNA_END=1316 /DNA_ORIENTATION=+
MCTVPFHVLQLLEVVPVALAVAASSSSRIIFAGQGLQLRLKERLEGQVLGGVGT